MNTIIKTKRLILRSWEKRDITSLYKLSQNNNVMQYAMKYRNVKEVEQFIRKLIIHEDINNFTLYCCTQKDKNDCIGFIGMIRTDIVQFKPQVELAWRLSYLYWGNGYATEGAKKIIDIAFEKLKLSSVISCASIYNVKSHKVMQRLGMIKKQSFNHPKVDTKHPLSKHILYEKYNDQ